MENQIFKIQKILRWIGLLLIVSLFLFLIEKQIPWTNKEGTAPKVHKITSNVVEPRNGAVNLVYKNGQR